MKIKFAPILALLLLSTATISLQASTPATFVQFNAANATISGADYKTLPISFSSTNTGRWNFDPTFTTPLVPATTTTTQVFGGINVVSVGTLGNTPYARLHNNNPPGWPNAPKVFVFSDAGSSGTNINNVNMLYLWKRSDFPGNQPSYSDTFNSSSTLSVHITDDAGVTGGDAQETRFIVLNGSTYYISEAKATATGTFTLTNFTNNSAAGFRWAPITLTGTSFDIPQSGLVYSAQIFGDVQAVGWIGRGSRTYTSLYAFDTFSATGLYSTPVMKLSMNLGGISYYATSHPFLDVFKYTTPWLTANSDNISAGPWDSNLTAYGLNVDANGWPTKLPFTQTLIPGPYTGDKQDPRTTQTSLLSSQQYVHTLVLVLESGRYRLRFRGTGSFSIQGNNGDGTNAFRTNFGPTVPGSNNPAGIAITSLPLDTDGVTRYWDSPTITVIPNSVKSYVYFAIYGSDPNSTGDYIRNVEFLSPSTFTAGVAGDTLNRITGPFNPDLCSTLHGFATLRMMDWSHTNSNPIVNWTDRILPSTSTQSQAKGIALEYQIAMCNTMGENMWINVPHQATADYITKLAQLIHNGSKADGTPYIPGTDAPSTLVWPGLNSNLKVYIEYSNETWNPNLGSQFAYCQSQGAALSTALGITFPTGANGDYYTVYQAANIWQTFYQVWGADATKRLVRVMATQFANTNAQIRMKAFFVPGLLPVSAQNQYPDALAVAPYFGGAVANSLVPTYISTDGLTDTSTGSMIIADAQADVVGNVNTMMTALKATANYYGVNLNCYEGGEGLAGSNGNQGNTTLTTDLENANRLPAMGTLYTQYLSELQSIGVVEFCHFDHISPWGGSGTWGSLEYLNEPITSTTAPKFLALQTYQTSFPNANSNIPPAIELTSTVSGTVVPVPAGVVDTTGAGSVVVPLTTANSVDYDGTIVSTQWTINNVIQSTTSSTFSPALPVGDNVITASVTDNSGASMSDTVHIVVRPKGSDTVIVTSNFTGAGNNIPTPLTQTPPWTLTSYLASGLGYTGWTYVRNTTGVYTRISDANYPNAYRVSLVNPYPSTGTPNSSTPELLTDALTQNQYLTVTVTPPSGHSLDLRGAAVQWTLNNQGNLQSAQQTALYTTAGSVFTTTPTGTAVYDSSSIYQTRIPSQATFTYYFPVTAANSNITTPTEIRIYFYGNMYGFKEIQLTNFQMTGIVH